MAPVQVHSVQQEALTTMLEEVPEADKTQTAQVCSSAHLFQNEEITNGN